MLSLIDEDVGHKNVIRISFAFGKSSLEGVGYVGFLLAFGNVYLHDQ